MADINTQTSAPIISGDHQVAVLRQKQRECEARIAAITTEDSNNNGSWCSGGWDGILCWDRVPAGQSSSQPCPGYIVGFQTQAEATKQCLEDGQWFVRNDTGLPWTNYSMCATEVDATVIMDFPGATNVTFMENYVPVVKAISRVGYAVSLASLVVAFCILAAVKKLRCPRNVLHMHLFLSFIMRAFMAFLKDSLFVMGLGLSSDLVEKTEGTYFGSEDEENWECKLITSLWQYFIMANYSWILMEGLYLHNLIFLALFSDTSSISLYVMLGWGMPAICVFSWVACRAVLEDTLCWTINQSAWLNLLIRVPTTLSIILNFILFMNIVRVLLSKLRSTVCEETKRYRRWAKSTLVLVPLFGVHYTVFLGLSYSIGIDPDVELAWLFCDQLFASFQGFFVAVLYCFMNGEVRSELTKKWRRVYPWKKTKRRTLSVAPGRHNQPRASCYSSTSCTSLSIAAPSLGSNWLLNKRRSASIQDSGRSFYSNLSEMSYRMTNGHDGRWSKSEYNMAGSVL